MLRRAFFVASAALMIFGSMLTMPEIAEAQIRDTTVTWSGAGSSRCRICSANYACSNGYGSWANGTKSFRDPLGSSYIVTRVDYFVNGVFGCRGNSNIQMRLNSLYLGSRSTNGGGCSCNSCASVSLSSRTYSTGLPGYRANSTNSVNLRLTSGLSCIANVRVRLHYTRRGQTCYRDSDGDGYGDPRVTSVRTTCNSGWVTNRSDCNDRDRSIRPGGSEVCNGVDDDCDNRIDENLFRYYYNDADNDGFGTSARVYRCSPTGSYRATRSGDCDDRNRSVRPGAREVCDNLDNDCDGTRDEGAGGRNWYFDGDRDGYGTSSSVFQCRASGSYRATRSGDCDDRRSNVNPGLAEVCGDGLDNNCNRQIDENQRTFYEDRDRDGYGNSSNTRRACTQPSGYTTRGGDCNDRNATVNPGRREVCDNIDNDCDRSVDEGFTHRTYYRDEDNDGYGASSRITECKAYGLFRALRSGDCDDRRSNVNPGLAEVCGDGLDNNCNGRIDENVQTFYRDNDGDGYGSSTSGDFCSVPRGYATRSGDCNDSNRAINPGAREVCDDIDNDCDRRVDEGFTHRTYYRDSDNDGYGTSSGRYECRAYGIYRALRPGDCDDRRANVRPGLAEVCGDGLDNNCNGRVDENIQTFYRDSDNDGYGNSSLRRTACTRPSGYVTNNTDCNDGNRNINPGAREVCDNLDNDCDRSVDEGIAHRYYYLDRDNDSYGTTSRRYECKADGVYRALRSGDCNDGSNRAFPGNPEVCGDGLDNDCNGQTDENIRTWYRDADSDSYGSATTRACTQPRGYVARGGDCNDSNRNINPGATEVCDGVDNNCVGGVDEGLRVLRYTDRDRDSYGVSSGTYRTTSSRQRLDSRRNPARWSFSNLPDALGVVTMTIRGCGDINSSSEYFDVRLDGARIGYAFRYGTSNCTPSHTFTISESDWNSRNSDGRIQFEMYRSRNMGGADVYFTLSYARGADQLVCPDAPGFATRPGDCNDARANVNPGHPEVCGDGLDNNCNNQIDENRRVFYQDRDGDGFGNNARSTLACSAPRGYVTNNTDCDDTRGNVHPGRTEVCDSLDNDCDRQVDEGLLVTQFRDVDRDSYGSTSAQVCPGTSGYVGRGGDCNDNNRNINPGHPEVCGDGLDNDCDRLVDENKSRFFVDSDRDGYGSSTTGLFCTRPSGYADRSGDCNDSNRAVNPGAREVCDNIDNNCDSRVDEGLRVELYEDVDRDGYGRSAADVSRRTSSQSLVPNRPVRYTFTDLPEASGNVRIGVYACGDINSSNEYITLRIDGTSVGDAYRYSTRVTCRNGSNGLAPHYITVSADAFNARARDGRLDFDLYASRRMNRADVLLSITYSSNNAGRVAVCPGTPGYTDRLGDCNDFRANMNPGASEVCGNGVDDNCDGEVDENIVTYFFDADRDSYGTSQTTQACTRPSGYATRGGDCNDTNRAINPGAREVCNGVDDNCDDRTDEGLLVTRFRDVDRDGFGRDSAEVCVGAVGYSARGGDCNDGDRSIFPGAREVCDNKDNNCNNQTDEGLRLSRFVDSDGDGFGSTRTQSVCPDWEGFSSNSRDCNDNNRAINPDATEICGNRVDDNCDNRIDENILTWYRDADRDTWGNLGSTTRACTRPSGYVARSGDCDDARNTVFPGAEEVCDGLDNDCDNSTDEGVTVSLRRDADGDGYGSFSRQRCQGDEGWVAQGGDCNDSNRNINPGASEVCGNNIDDNCNNQIDENKTTYFVDRDGDNYGDRGTTTQSCSLPTGYSTNGNDCNDTNPRINPGAREVCDNLDNNCQNGIDEGLRITRHRDSDGDSYGTSQTASVCPQWTGFANRGGDCNDGEAAINPSALEVCDFVDNNCNDVVDEGGDGGRTLILRASTQVAVNYGFRFWRSTRQDILYGYSYPPAGYDITSWLGFDLSQIPDNAVVENVNLFMRHDRRFYSGSPRLRFFSNSANNWNTSATNQTLRRETIVSSEFPSGSFGRGALTSFALNNSAINWVAELEDDWLTIGLDENNPDNGRAHYAHFMGRSTGSSQPLLVVRVRGTGGTLRVDKFRDSDGDGYGATRGSVCQDTVGYVDEQGDCDDTNRNVNPSAAEICGNRIDDNCDGAVDENIVVWNRDRDGDGFGTNQTTRACTRPDGFTNRAGDCNDGEAAINPDATEVCDYVDNNCNNETDEGLRVVRFRDADGDGFGTAQRGSVCANDTGWSTRSDDCDDRRNLVNPGADEVCGNNIDDNCNDAIDENKLTFYLDRDSDTYGGSTSTLACSRPSGYVARSGDCVDTNRAINPGATEVCNETDDNCNQQVDEGIATSDFFLDVDGDDYGTSAKITACRARGNFRAPEGGDCNDGNQNINPGATEVCDFVDNNCRNGVDEGVRVTRNRDVDGDGYGTSQTASVCSDTRGYADRGGDCNDRAVAINPGAAEICGNDIDDNCNNETDENILTWFRDADRDNFGNASSPTQACSQPSGYVAVGRDCNDDNPQVNPNATEVCNQVDDDCDNQTDEGLATSTFFLDGDRDTFGTDTNPIVACGPRGRYSATRGGDCNDGESAINPGATEVCANNLDDNCNNVVDEGTLTWYLDSDGDEFGDNDRSARACVRPDGYVRDNTDCDDARANVNPGETEVCDALDNDCDQQTDEGLRQRRNRDADGDGYGTSATSLVCPQWDGWADLDGDCNDRVAAINPGASETCGDGVDNNCDGNVDENVRVWYLDSDADTWGSARQTRACDRPRGYVARTGDCNDSSDAINPDATEVCNGVDDDCDEGVDEDLLVQRFRDADLDGFGSSRTANVCPDAVGYSSRAGDCDDTRRTINPDAQELCGNNLDDDCDTEIDENKTVFYRDFDGDNFGNPNNSSLFCARPNGYVSNNTDCNDGAASINPDAAELCNATDDNCNTQIDEGNPEAGAQCDTGLPGACAEASTTICLEGSVVCGPKNVAGFGEVSTVEVPGGLVGRRNGVENGDFKLLTSNGVYLFNLAYGRNGGTGNGYTVRVFDPSANFALVKSFGLGDTSNTINGVSARGDILYAIEFDNTNGASVTEINWRTEVIERTSTIDQRTTQSVEGQYDLINDVHWLGSLRDGAQIYEHRGSEISAQSRVRFFDAQGIEGSPGTVASDGRFLYVKQWSNYPGSEELVRIGTGYNNTVRGGNYGSVAAVPSTLSTAYHPDGHVYIGGRGDANTLTRVKVTASRREICDDGIDNNCNGGVDDYCPSPTPYDNFDGGLARCDWNVTSSHGQATEPEVANGVLKAKLARSLSGEPNYNSGLGGRFRVGGDFDVEVDFQLVRWHPESGVRVNLTAAGVSAQRLNDRGGNERYGANFGGDLERLVSTNQNSGRLRIKRVGDTITTMYDDAGWREFGSRSGQTTETTVIELSISGGGSLPGDIEVHFDNFTVSEGSIGEGPAFGPETCDGLDNDCDGETDESTNVACSSECGAGVQVCVDGTLTACSARQPDDSEYCDDGIDNDCNGETDEHCGGFDAFDNFDDGNIAACRWRTSTSPSYNQGNNSGLRVDESGEEGDNDGKALRIRFGANTTGGTFIGGITSRFGVEGDFDVEVVYGLPRWPSRSDVHSSLTVSGGGASTKVIRVSDRDAGESYISEIAGTLGARRSTSARSGRLRVIRAGNVVRTLVMDGTNGRWIQNSAGAFNTANVTISLNAWGHDFVPGDVTATFDNLAFNGCNETPCRTWTGGRLVSFGGIGTPEGAFDQTTCDGLDNDCDGLTDGFNRGCETLCGVGTETCTLGNWGSCTAREPISEVCDGADNDCDGDVDESDPNEDTFCVVNGQQGVCSQGRRVCRGDRGLVCEGPSAGAEVCDGLDNDCDGTTDETGTTPEVMSGDDVAGYWSFEESSGSTFRDNAGANNEGRVARDARLGRLGRYGKGLELDGNQDHAEIVAEGTELDLDAQNQITIAAWLYPRRHITRAFTIYRGGSYYLTLLDGRPAFYGYGLSEPGYHTAGQALELNTWSHVAVTYDGSTVRVYINGEVSHSAQTTGAFRSDTSPLVFGHKTTAPNTAFNGFIDEVIISRVAMNDSELASIAAPDMPGSGVTCDTGNLGVCQQGASVCQGGSFICTGASPRPERCDGLDNNCDGSVDEGNPQGGGTCVTQNPGICRVGSFQCTAGSLVCAATAPGDVVEVCDGQDNDCDGQTDESFPSQGSDCSTGRRGICATGQRSCVEGNEVCLGSSPQVEVCDNQDNDCDGSVDETLTRTCSSICGGGTESCSAGNWAGCTARQPTPEICDNQDNDCDGRTDESIRRSCRTDCGGGTQLCGEGVFGACSAPLPRTETCDGLDNDCNGFIDDSVDCGCQYFPRDEAVQPVIEWTWTRSDTEPDYDQVVMTPISGPLVDTDFNGRVNEEDIPAVLFTTIKAGVGEERLGGYLRAVRGSDGQELWTYTARKVYAGSSPALGDLDDDGVPEVVAYAWRDAARNAPQNAGLVALDGEGNELWNNTDVNRGGQAELGSPAIANIDPDSPGNEIASCFWLVSATGETLFDNWDNLPDGHSPRGFCSPLVADIDNDNRMEIVIGARAYNHDGSIAWTNTQLYGQWGQDFDIAPAIADLDEDGNPEIIVVRGAVYVLDAATGELLAQHAIPGGGQGGAPNVADFDGDGLPEIGTAGAQAYAVYKLRRVNNIPTLSVLWQRQTRDFSSGVSGSSVFHFNGDGVADVVYNDELFLRVFNGRTGEIVFTEDNASTTQVEYPVIVDADNDGNAEIIVGRSDGSQNAGLRVYGDANDNWVNTRTIWNQYSYHVTNVSDNGSIPITETRGWTQRATNNFRNNFQGDQGLFAAPDLTATLEGDILRGAAAGNYENGNAYCPAFTSVTLKVCNAGDVAVPAGAQVAVYLGHPEDDGVLVSSATTTSRLEEGDNGNCEEVVVEWNSERAGTHELFAFVDFENRHNECDEENNIRSLGVQTLQIVEEEKCDNVDNNCDTVIDESLSRDCSSECGTGTEVCDAGEWGECTSPGPTDEVCDGEDNDCNGVVDDGACPANFVCNHDSLNDTYECVAALTVGGDDCGQGCALGSVCEDGQCVPHCVDDFGCPGGESCVDNVCVIGESPQEGGLGQSFDEEPERDVSTPLGACSASSVTKGAAPIGGLSFLIFGLALLWVRRRKRD
jgi:hypothetical protein